MDKKIKTFACTRKGCKWGELTLAVEASVDTVTCLCGAKAWEVKND